MDYKHDLGNKSRERQSWFAPLLVVLVIVLALVIDSRDVSTKHPSLAFVHVREQRPAFDPATLKAR